MKQNMMNLINISVLIKMKRNGVKTKNLLPKENGAIKKILSLLFSLLLTKVYLNRKRKERLKKYLKILLRLWDRGVQSNVEAIFKS